MNIPLCLSLLTIVLTDVPYCSKIFGVWFPQKGPLKLYAPYKDVTHTVPCSSGIANSNTCTCWFAPWQTWNDWWGYLNATSCIPGFHVDEKARCLMDNCGAMASNSTCAYCDRGYFLTNNGQQCNKCTYPCSSCSSESWCTACASSDYYLAANGVCTVKNCAGMSGSVCTVCKPGYYLTRFGLKCEQCVAPCKTCVDAKTCSGCIDGFEIAGSACTIPNCAKVAGLKCETCKPGYYKAADGITCFACSSNCATCSGASGGCLTCPAGLLLDEKTKKCIVQGCTRMSGNVCVECGSGLFVDTTGAVCSPCTKPCKTCRGFGDRCTSCESGYDLASSSCSYPNCAKMAGTSCTTCQNGYYLTSKQTCAQCGATCAQCSGAADRCTACPNGLQLSSGACTVPNCKTMEGPKCTACISRFYLAGPQSCKECTLPCFECSETATHCTSCFGGYTLVNNECTVPNCDTMEGAVCSTCRNGYYLTEDRGRCLRCSATCGTCSGKSDACASCKAGQMLDAKTKTCIHPNCEKMSGSVCLDCKEGLYPGPDGGSCLPCTPPCKDCLGAADMCVMCNTSYNLNAARCVVPNCKTMNGEECSECDSGFFKKGPLACEKCQAPCQECTGSAMSCTKCSFQYKLANSKCVVPNCDKMDGRTCKECQSGFHLASGGMQCLPCTEPCLTCSGSGTACTSCGPGYSLDAENKKCVIPQCANMLRERCTRCSDGYFLTLDGSACLQCTAVCKTCIGTEDICLSCDTSYQFSSYACLVQNCARMDGKECRECIEGYYSDGPMSCKKCQAPCATCSGGAAQCTTCMGGYGLENGKCVVRNCDKMSGLACSECKKGYYLVGGGMFCFQCVSSCAACDKDSTTCTACADGYLMAPGTSKCFKNDCGKCINGQCITDAMTQSRTCKCPEEFVLVGGTCMKDLCGACIGGQCLLDPDFTNLCDCGDGKRLFGSNCVPNKCGPCTGGTCLISADQQSFTCTCAGDGKLDAAGTACLQTNRALGGLKPGYIAAIVICGSVGLILILLVIILPIKYCCNREHRVQKEDEMDPQFSSFDRFSNGQASVSARSFRQEASAEGSVSNQLGGRPRFG